MRILLDHCLPKRLKRLFPSHEVKTAQEMGWSGLANGQLLLEAAAAGFSVMLTVDRNISFQQNPDRLPLPIIVLVAKNNRFETLALLKRHGMFHGTLTHEDVEADVRSIDELLGPPRP